MSGADPVGRPRPAGVIVGALRVLALAVRTQTFDRRMLLPLGVLAAMPAMAILGDPAVPPDLDGLPPAVAIFHRGYEAHFLGPVTLLVTLLLATAALGDELERRTLVHFFVRPLPRGGLYFGKLAWIAGTAWLGLTLAATVTLMALATRAGGDVGVDYLVALCGAFALSVSAYSALFFGLVLLLPFPTIAGLGYGFGVEMILGRLPGYFAWGSVGFHVRSLLEQRLAEVHASLAPASGSGSDLASAVMGAMRPPAPTPGQSLAILGGLCLVCVLAGWALAAWREFAGRLGQSE